MYGKSICLNCFSLRIETFNEFSVPPPFVRNKSYKYEPEFIPLFDHCDQRLVHDGWAPYGHREAGGAQRSRRNRLCSNGGISDSCFLLSPVVTCSSIVTRCISVTLFAVADTSVHSSERVISAGQFILGYAVSFYFIVNLAILELCSIRLKIIRFYSEHFIA